MTDTHPHYLFVYGTLRRGNGNNPLLTRHDSIYVGPAVTVDRFLLNDGFPYVFPDPESAKTERFLGRVRGDLYRVTDEGLQACDWLEGHPTSYTRTPVEVEYFLDGPGEQQVTAGIYLILGHRWSSGYQEPDEHGYLEWGRDEPERARDFQRRSGSRFSK